MSRPEASARALAAALLTLVLACSGGSPQPVEIALDEDICSFCRMAVSQRQFAAELVTAAGGVEVFDDIGCLVDWLGEHGRPPGAAAFVVDFDTGRWLAAETAAYVRSPQLPTPMRHGLAAFADRGEASAAIGKLGGEVVTWRDLTAEDGR